MLSLVPNVYQSLMEQADERGISIQELLRAVVVPEWLAVPVLPAMPVTVAGPKPGQIGNRWPKD